MRTPRLCAAQIKRKNPSKKMAHEETHSTMEQDVPTNKKAGQRRSKHHHSRKSGHHHGRSSHHHQSKHHQEKDVIITNRHTPKGHHDKTTSRKKAPGRYGEDDGEVPPAPRMPQYYYDEEAAQTVSNIRKVEGSPAVPKQEEMYNIPHDWQPSKASHDEKGDWKQSDVDAKPAAELIFTGKSSRMAKGPDLAPWPNANQTKRTMSHPASTKQQRSTKPSRKEPHNSKTARLLDTTTSSDMMGIGAVEDDLENPLTPTAALSHSLASQGAVRDSEARRPPAFRVRPPLPTQPDAQRVRGPGAPLTADEELEEDTSTSPMSEIPIAATVVGDDHERLRKEVQRLRAAEDQLQNAPVAQVIKFERWKKLALAGGILAVLVVTVVTSVVVTSSNKTDSTTYTDTTLSNGTWVQLGPSIEGPEIGDHFGLYVSLAEPGGVSLFSSMDRIVVSAPGSLFSDNNPGRVLVYDIDGDGATTQVGDSISGTEGGNGARGELSKDGRRLAVGEPGYSRNGEQIGQVRVYELGSQQSNTIGGNATWALLGKPIYGDGGTGESIALSRTGDTLAVGSQSRGKSGHVRIYQYDSGSWAKRGSDIHGFDAWDKSGYSLSLSDDGTIIAVGADYFMGSQNKGQVRVYQYKSGDWVQMGIDISGYFKWNGDLYGVTTCLSSDGQTVAASALSSYDRGYAGVFSYDVNDEKWHQLGGSLEGDGGDDVIDEVSLSADGRRVAVASTWGTVSYVYIYSFVAGAWHQVGQKLTSQNSRRFLDTIIVDDTSYIGTMNGASDDSFGASISFSSVADRLIIGIPAVFADPDRKGQVRLFELQVAD